MKAHLDAPEIEPGIVAKQTVTGANGTHQIKVRTNGQIVLCSKCAEIRAKYVDELAANPELRRKLDDIESLLDPRVKARKAAEFELKVRQMKETGELQSAAPTPILDKGKAFEERVKSIFRRKIIRENEPLIDEVTGKQIGEIDFETNEAIVEVGISLGGKSRQLRKLAELTKQRGKRLDIIYGSDTQTRRLHEMQEAVAEWGRHVRFIPNW